MISPRLAVLKAARSAQLSFSSRLAFSVCRLTYACSTSALAFSEGFVLPGDSFTYNDSYELNADYHGTCLVVCWRLEDGLSGGVIMASFGSGELQKV